MQLSFFLLSAVLACAAWALPARAEEPASERASDEDVLDDERAHAHYLAGESHFAAERWADAVREFALAYQFSRRPEMLINLSRAHERAGELDAAVADLERLLREYPETNYRLEAEQRIANMRAKRESTPVPPVELPAPVIEAPAQTPPPVQSPPSAWPPRWPTVLVGSVALAAGVTSLATGLRAHGIYQDLSDRCPRDRCPDEFASDRDKGRALSRASTGLLFTSIALAGTTAVLWLVDHRREQRTQLGFGGTSLLLRTRF
ncbi:MAG TPA: tetratricopeptide repeat protein [Polyangiales bacterium]